MTDVLALVDAGQFGKLFLEELGWSAPNQAQTSVTTAEGNRFHLDQVAMYKGMGVWQCNGLPTPKEQRQIDAQIAHKNTERLIIYSDGTRQEWRWPRYNRNRTTGQPSLVPHRHVAGQPNPNLVDRLNHISIGMGEDISVLELLHRMREAFDQEAETASRQAARLMGSLYERLDTAGMNDDDASAFLARALFLMFGDDTDMWPNNVFFNFLADDTHPDGSDLNAKLQEVFIAANTDVKKRPADLTASLQRLPYINGGIFADSLDLPKALGSEFRTALLEACKFDWGQISPAVFGSMFQTVKSQEARRHLGEHYTTEKNILKTIEPLFLNELNDALEEAWDDAVGLKALRERMGEMRFLDPACGCGNFLIVAYREMRSIELEILKRLRDLALSEVTEKSPLGESSKGKKRAASPDQLTVDATLDLRVSIDNFYGIEIEAWPAKIAETAMFLIDHQANLRMESELGQAPRRLPIEIAPHIHLGDALSVNWASHCPPGDAVRVMGNPPFAGRYTRTAQMTAALKDSFGNIPGSGNIDFVCAWFAKSADYLQRNKGRAAFVSTNSIAQGEQPGVLWGYLTPRGMQIDFAYRTFPWANAEAGEAAVHCVITGFSSAKAARPAKWLWLESSSDAETAPVIVENINGYLAAGPSLIISSRRSPLDSSMPTMRFGSMPHDGGHLLLNEGEQAELLRMSPEAAPFIRRVVGASELIKNAKRFCIWVTDEDQEEALRIPEFKRRADEVALVREASPDDSANAAVSRPLTFKARRQPTTKYIAVPGVSSERRAYVPMALLSPTVIATNLLLTVAPANLYVFGLLQSRVFNIWNSAVSGRLKSDVRISAEITYNNFPWPEKSSEAVALIESYARNVLKARESEPNATLADLYDPNKSPTQLLQAHAELDTAVLSSYGLGEGVDDAEVLSALFSRYLELTDADQLHFNG